MTQMPSHGPRSGASPAPHSAGSQATYTSAAGVAPGRNSAPDTVVNDPARNVELDDDQLTDGAAGIILSLLPSIRQTISDQVMYFLQDVGKAALVDLKGVPESDLGLSLFKVLGDIAIAAFPEIEGVEVVLMEVGKEAATGFGDLWTDHIKKGQEETAAANLDDAKGRLLTAGKAIGKAATDGADDFFNLLHDKGKLQQAAHKILSKHPELARYGGNDENQQALANAMGVTTRVTQRFANLGTELSAQFQDELTRVKLDLEPHSFQGDAERLKHLIEVHEKEGKDPYAEVDHLGWHHDFWDPFIRLYFMAGTDTAFAALASKDIDGVAPPDPADYLP